MGDEPEPTGRTGCGMCSVGVRISRRYATQANAPQQASRPKPQRECQLAAQFPARQGRRLWRVNRSCPKAARDARDPRHIQRPNRADALPVMDPGWLLYLGIFLGPFVQEDAAVIAAATLSAADAAHFPVIFFVILSGLFLSDIWKYWIGRAAHTSSRARAYAERGHVVDFADRVSRNLFTTLLGARFLPLARIPVYVACGYFKVGYAKFCAMIFATALLYCAVIFGLCHGLGELFGDRIELILGSLAAIVIGVGGAAYSIRRWMRRS